MNISDLSILAGTQLLYPSVNTATVTGPVIDLQQYIGTLKISQHVGAVSGTGATLTGVIMQSTDGVNFTASPLAFAPVTTANNTQAIQGDTRALPRYIQYVGTIAGTSPSIVSAASVLSFKKVN